jgi:hypothetical protein
VVETVRVGLAGVVTDDGLTAQVGGEPDGPLVMAHERMTFAGLTVFTAFTVMVEIEGCPGSTDDGFIVEAWMTKSACPKADGAAICIITNVNRIETIARAAYRDLNMSKVRFK